MLDKAGPVSYFGTLLSCCWAETRCWHAHAFILARRLKVILHRPLI